MGGFDELAAQFDPVDTNVKGDQFELVCKWFLENEPTYQPLLRKVWLWDDWPGRWDSDGGIDLVAEGHNEEIWAIQAKAYDAAYSITKERVDSFISESSRPIVKHRLLMGTTDKRARRAVRLMDDLGIPFIGLTQLRDTNDYLNWPDSLADLRPAAPLEPKKPHDYQETAIKDVIEGFKSADRGQLIMACGTGKTLTAWFINEKLAAKRTLVLVPSLSLLKQTILEWRTAEPGSRFVALPVCSDETAGSLGEDAAVSHTSDLGLPVTTDPAEIAAFLCKRSGQRVVFATYQSSPQIAAAFKLGRVPEFDLIIADEAHRVAGPVSSEFGTVLEASAIKGKRRLFMTATPRYFTGRVLRAASEADYEVASMDDQTRFGPVFHRFSFSEAIELNRLTDYQVAVIGVDDATYRDWAKRAALVTLDGKKTTDARSLAGQIGLAKAIKKFDLHRVISFHGRVKAAKDFAVLLKQVVDWTPENERPSGKIWAEHASGEMPAGERDVLIQRLKFLDEGERGLLSNARCLSEGVNVPALDGVAFIDPRRSEVDIVQAVGRAIRKSETKTVGTIVIPVFIDVGEDAETVLDSSVFKPVWDVVKALRAHDTQLGEQLDALRRQMGRRGGRTQLPSKIHIDVPTTVGKDFAQAFDAWLVAATTAPWEFWYGLLEEYLAENGHVRVPKGYKTTDKRALGVWAATQRRLRNAGQLAPERQSRLEAVHPTWTWDPNSDRFDEGFAQLVKYVEIKHHARVPYLHETDGGFPLGQWIKDRRVEFAKGKLSADRQARLEGVHRTWTWDPHTDQWEEYFSELERYVATHNDARVPQGYKTPQKVRLGKWVNKQRNKKADGKLEADRQARLEAVHPSWTWDLRIAKWEDGYTRLIAYADEHHHARVPQSYRTADDFRLGQWVGNRRAERKAGTLDPEHERLLEQVPGWTWDASADRSRRL